MSSLHERAMMKLEISPGMWQHVALRLYYEGCPSPFQVPVLLCRPYEDVDGARLPLNPTVAPVRLLVSNEHRLRFAVEVGDTFWHLEASDDDMFDVWTTGISRAIDTAERDALQADREGRFDRRPSRSLFDSALSIAAPLIQAFLADDLPNAGEDSDTASCSTREELEELEEPEAEAAALVSRLREQHQLEAGRSAALESELAMAKTEIERLREQLEAAQTENADPQKHKSGDSSDAAAAEHTGELERLLVTQLRFRSSQLESVNERLDEEVKEKRALEVKLTALEAWVVEHCVTTHPHDTKNTAELTEMQRELDQKSAQLSIAEREVVRLRSQIAGGDAGASGSIVAMPAKVTPFKEAARLQRNFDRVKVQEEMSGRRAAVAHRESVNRTDPRSQRTPSIPKLVKTEEKKASTSHRASPPSPVQTAKASHQNANAAACTSARPTASTTSGVRTSSKVAPLKKNSTSTTSVARSPRVLLSGMAMKRSTKPEFRDRKGSTACQTASSTTATSRLPRPQTQRWH